MQDNYYLEIIQKQNVEIEEYKKLITQFKGLLDSIPDPVFMKDENLKWLYGNPIILRLYDIDPLNYIGKTEDELLPAEFAESCMESDKYAKESKVLNKSEERARDENDNLKYYEVFKVPFYDDNEVFKGLIGVGRDITATKLAYQELEKSLENQKILTQQAKLAAMGEMLENIAHQWKLPLSIISFSIAILRLQTASHHCQATIDEIDSIERNIAYMGQTIECFKEFLIENKEKQDFMVADSIDECIAILVGYFNKYSINIIKEYTDDVILYGSKNEFKQVIINLLSNAKDALISKNIKEKRINIILEKSDNFCLLKIVDNAGGIDKDNLPYIFDKFFTTKANGTGIGLHMSQQIASDNFNASISAENTADGVMFILEFPLTVKS